MDMNPEHLVRTHGPRLRALAARLVGEGDADDVVQRAWVAAWKAKPRSPEAWLDRVVRRIAGHHRRDEAAVRERERRAASVEAGQDPTAPLERREALEALAVGLGALPSTWAEVVLLRYADGQSPREVAKRLDIPVNTVRSRAQRGLAQLREELERRGTDWRPALAILAVPSPREPAVAASLGVFLMSTKTVAALTLIATAVVVSSSALYLELSKPETSSDIEAVSISEPPRESRLSEAVSSSEPPRESRLSEARPSMLDSPTDEQRMPQAEAGPVSETPYTTLTESELFALEQSFEALHYDATEAQLLSVYEEAMERMPTDAIMTLHLDKIQQGDFEVLDVPTEMVGTMRRFTYTQEVLQSNKPVLSMTHSQTDGRLLRTWITPAALPGFEQDILYVNWMMDRLRSRR